MAAGVLRIALAAGFEAQLNAKVQCLGSTGNTAHHFRPADILLNEGTGRQTCIDVTIVSPMCTSYANINVGELATKKADEKIKKHLAACEQAGYDFLPFAIDTCGVMDARANILLTRLANAYEAISGLADSHSKAICRRRISLCLQRGISTQLTSLVLSDYPDFLPL